MDSLEIHKNKEIPKWKNQLISIAVWVANKINTTPNPSSLKTTSELPPKISRAVTNENLVSKNVNIQQLLKLSLNQKQKDTLYKNLSHLDQNNITKPIEYGIFSLYAMSTDQMDSDILKYTRQIDTYTDKNLPVNQAALANAMSFIKSHLTKRNSYDNNLYGFDRLLWSDFQDIKRIIDESMKEPFFNVDLYDPNKYRDVKSEQLDALNMYQSAYHSTINKFLRTNKFPDYESAESQQICKHAIPQIDNLFKTQNETNSQILYRGISKRLSQTYTVGDEIEDLGYMSTSKSLYEAEKFGKCILRITNNKMIKTLNVNKLLVEISIHKNEEEVLLQRGTKLRVSHITNENGVTYIDVEPISPVQKRENDKHILALEKLKTSPKAEEAQSAETVNKESKDVPKSAYEAAKHILSPEGKKEYLAKLEEILSTPEAIEILELNQKRSATFDDPTISYFQGAEVRDSIDSQLDKFNPDLKMAILNTNERLASFKRRENVFIQDSEAIELISKLIDGASNQDNEYEFSDLFRLQPLGVSNSADYNIETFISEKISIPLNLIVGADGFVNWNGRGKDEKKDEKLSSDVIQEYASRDTSPTVNQLTMFVYPTGEIFFQTHNSHRVAAMKLRGDKTIDFKRQMDIVVMGEEDESPVKEKF